MVKEKKAEGWIIHFTRKESPYETLAPFIDQYLPYWEENKEIISHYYSPETEVLLAGICYQKLPEYSFLSVAGGR